MFSQNTKEKEAHASKNNSKNLGGCFHSIDQGDYMLELQLNSVM